MALLFACYFIPTPLFLASADQTHSEFWASLNSGEEAWLQTQQPLKMVYDPDWAPFEWKGPEGKHTGVIADIIKIIESNTGLNIKVVNTSTWAESVDLVKNGEADFFSAITVTEERKQYLDFTHNDIYSYPAVLLTRFSDTAVYLDAHHDLAGKKIGIVKSSGLGSYIQNSLPQPDYVEVVSTASGFEQLRDGEIDLFAINSISGRYYIENKGFDTVKVALKLDYTYSLKIAARKDLPQEVISILNKGLGSITSHEINNAVAGWIQAPVKERIDWFLLAKITLGFTLIIAFLMWNSYQLRKKVSRKTSELQGKTVKLEESVAAKTRFLAAASHDLRQPLHAMGLFLDILHDQSRGMPQMEIIEKIKKSGAAMENLLISLLDISKLDAGIINVDIKPFKVQQLFDLLADEFESIAREKQLELRFVPCSLHLNSDRQLVERILRNLISNAIRYTEHGKILVGCRRRTESAVISVCDTGIGIDPDKKETVFEEFQQLNNDSRDRSKGLGLGLAIVQRLAALLESKLSLQTIRGKGSVFSIELPRATIEDITQVYFSAQASSDEIAGKYVVIVEDEVEIREGLRQLLTQWGCEVEELSEVKSVERILLKSIPPDLILTDYRLPEHKTGVDAINAIQDFYQDSTIPAIIVTGDTSPERIKQADESGYVVLNKPVPGGKLRAAMNSLLLSV